MMVAWCMNTGYVGCMNAGDVRKAEIAWVERDDSNQIGHALGDAYEGFDATYYQSETASDLRTNAEKVIAALTEVLRLTEDAACGCYACIGNKPSRIGGVEWLTVGMTRMIVCTTCGNKRCPHGTDHRNACTGSNEPGQDGSRYGGLPNTSSELRGDV